MPTKKRVAAAISGGVDSAVSAHLLKKQGYWVIGLFMRLEQGKARDEAAARKVCRKLNILFYPVNLGERFEQEVIEYFLQSYQRGVTPNPCIKCNNLIKFGELMRIASDLDAEFLASGHYARIKQNLKISNVQLSNYTLTRPKDRNKDQTYFLYTLSQNQMSRIIFPLADLTKEEVKKIAKKEDLPVLEKESSDICFLGKDARWLDHNEYLKENIHLKPGKIMTMDGKPIGRHKGLPLYTVGQRKGIEIGGIGPFYAAKADYKKNILYVVADHDDPALFEAKFMVTNTNWISGMMPKLPLVCRIMIRYRSEALSGLVRILPKSHQDLNIDGRTYLVVLDQPARAVTPGQSAVFYLEDEVVGGGVIDFYKKEKK